MMSRVDVLRCCVVVGGLVWQMDVSRWSMISG